MGDFLNSCNGKTGARLLRVIQRKKVWTYQHRKHRIEVIGEKKGEKNNGSLNEAREQVYMKDQRI